MPARSRGRSRERGRHGKALPPLPRPSSSAYALEAELEHTGGASPDRDQDQDHNRLLLVRTAPTAHRPGRLSPLSPLSTKVRPGTSSKGGWKHWQMRSVGGGTGRSSSPSMPVLGQGLSSASMEERPRAPAHAPSTWDAENVGDDFVAGRHGAARDGGGRRVGRPGGGHGIGPGDLGPFASEPYAPAYAQSQSRSLSHSRSQAGRSGRGCGGKAAKRILPPSMSLGVGPKADIADFGGSDSDSDGGFGDVDGPGAVLLHAHAPSTVRRREKQKRERDRRRQDSSLGLGTGSGSGSGTASLLAAVGDEQRLSVLDVNAMHRDALWRGSGLDESQGRGGGIDTSPLSEAEKKRRRIATQSWHAATWLQARFRGARCRRQLWASDAGGASARPGGTEHFGLLRNYEVLRIQRMWRGSRGRRLAAERRAEWHNVCAFRIQGMLHMMRRRRLEARVRAKRWHDAAIAVQRVWRGKNGRGIWDRVWHLLELYMAAQIERVYRGHRGRHRVRAYRGLRARMEQMLLTGAAQAVRGELLSSYEAQICAWGAEFGVPPHGCLGPAEVERDAHRRCVGTRPPLLPMPLCSCWSALPAWVRRFPEPGAWGCADQQRVARGKTFSCWHVEVPGAKTLRGRTLEVLLCYLCGREDGSRALPIARDGRRLFPRDAVFAYMEALALLSSVEGIEGLVGTTQANARRLDEAMDALRVARVLDTQSHSERTTALAEVEPAFEAALRIAPRSGVARMHYGLLLACAPALSEPMRSPDPRWVPLRWRPMDFKAVALERARRYLDGAIELKPTHFAVCANVEWFYALHATKPSVLASRSRRLGSDAEFRRLRCSKASNGMALIESEDVRALRRTVSHVLNTPMRKRMLTPAPLLRPPFVCCSVPLIGCAQIGALHVHADEVEELFGEHIDPEMARKAKAREQLREAARRRALATGCSQSRAASRARRQMHAAEQARRDLPKKVELAAPHGEQLLSELVIVRAGSSALGAAGAAWRLALPRLAAKRQGVQARFDREKAVLHLQRSHRGFSARARVNRIRARIVSRMAQTERFHNMLRARERLRKFRFLAASRVQALWRSIYTRRRIEIETRASIECQKIARGYLVRLRIAQAREAERLGLAVETVFRRGLTVSGRHMVVEILQCGKSFKFVGTDMEDCCEYNGFLTGEELANRRVKTHLAVEYITRGLALVDAIGATTGTLRARDPSRKVLIVDAKFGARATGEGVQGIRKRPNVLKDEADAARLVRGARNRRNIDAALQRRDRAGLYFRALEETYAEVSKLSDAELEVELRQKHRVPDAELTELHVKFAEKEDPDGLSAELASRLARERALAAFAKKAGVLPVATMKAILIDESVEVSNDELGLTDQDVEAKEQMAWRVARAWQKQCECINLTWGSGGKRAAFSWRGDYVSPAEIAKANLQPER